MTSIQGLATRRYLGQSIYLGHLNYEHEHQRLCLYKKPHLHRGILKTVKHRAFCSLEERGWAGTHHCGELLGEAIKACKTASVSHILSGLVQRGETMWKMALQPSCWFQSMEFLLKWPSIPVAAAALVICPETQLFNSTLLERGVQEPGTTVKRF